MAYRNKTYVIFNADYPNGEGDIGYYRLMQAWKANDRFEFDFYDAHQINNLTARASEEQIKRKLRERMSHAKLAIVLVGDHTKNMHKFVRWEQEIAIELGVPIVAVNLDGSNLETDKLPPILRTGTYVTCPFKVAAVQHCIDHWPTEHKKLGGHTSKSGGYHYKMFG